MSFWDDIQSTAEDAGKSVAKSAGEFFSGAVQSVVLKNGPAPSGNLNQSEIDAGARGEGQGVRSADVDMSQVKYNAFGLSFPKSGGSMLAVAVAAAVGAYFIFGRRRRG